jgi:molecular chaperone GrpE
METTANTPESQADESVKQEQPSTEAQTSGTGGDISNHPDYKAAQEQIQSLNNQNLRLAADFDNFRKRTLQEQDNIRKYGAEQTLTQLMPVLDNLERAKQSLSENADPKLLYQSFEMMYKQLTDAFEGLGVKRIDCMGQPFDPNCHEAVTQLPTNDHPEGTVVQEMRSGFMVHDRVVRPSMVAVAVPAEASSDAKSADKNPFAQNSSV